MNFAFLAVAALGVKLAPKLNIAKSDIYVYQDPLDVHASRKPPTMKKRPSPAQARSRPAGSMPPSTAHHIYEEILPLRSGVTAQSAADSGYLMPVKLNPLRSTGVSSVVSHVDYDTPENGSSNVAVSHRGQSAAASRGVSSAVSAIYDTVEKNYSTPESSRFAGPPPTKPKPLPKPLPASKTPAAAAKHAGSKPLPASKTPAAAERAGSKPLPTSPSTAAERAGSKPLPTRPSTAAKENGHSRHRHGKHPSGQSAGVTEGTKHRERHHPKRPKSSARTQADDTSASLPEPKPAAPIVKAQGNKWMETENVTITKMHDRWAITGERKFQLLTRWDGKTLSFTDTEWAVLLTFQVLPDSQLKTRFEEEFAKLTSLRIFGNRVLKQSSKLFGDAEFHYSGLITQGVLANKLLLVGVENSEKASWVPVSDLYPRAPFYPSTETNSQNSSIVGGQKNAWLVAGLRSMTRNQYQAMISQTKDVAGRYTVTLFDPKGKADSIQVLIDDMLPRFSLEKDFAAITCGEDSEQHFSWAAPLIEKAIAQYFGGYALLQKEWFTFGLKTLFGFDVMGPDWFDYVPAPAQGGNKLNPERRLAEAPSVMKQRKKVTKAVGKLNIQENLVFVKFNEVTYRVEDRYTVDDDGEQIYLLHVRHPEGSNAVLSNVKWNENSHLWPATTRKAKSNASKTTRNFQNGFFYIDTEELSLQRTGFSSVFKS